jgi:ubiquinone/menaquinone biosynthesis C-methylase UbiE
MINKNISINNKLWKKNDKNETEWHEKQYHHLKQISIEFEKFINKQLKLSSNIIDLGGGSGSTTAYLANLHPDKKFTVFDINPNLIKIGKKYSKDIKNLTFQQGNFFNLKKRDMTELLAIKL